MTVQRIGDLSLAEAVPLLAAMASSLSVAVGFAQPELEAKLAGLGQVLAAIQVAPPDLEGTIEAAIAVVGQLEAAVSGPTVSLEIAAIVALIAELNVSLGQIALAAALEIPSGTLSAYVFDGPTANFGAEMQTALNATLPGAPASTHALVLATTSAPAWVAASAVFKVTP